MQGEQLLQDPDFAQTLAKSPFKAEDLPGLSTAIAQAFERMTPEQKVDLKNGLEQLERLSADDLSGIVRLLDYVAKNPDQYPRLVEELSSSGAFDPEDIPKDYDPKFLAVVKSIVGFALSKKQGMPGYAKGGIASLKDAADKVQFAGRDGDTMLAHINPFEAEMLKRMGGRGTVNPETGLPEFGWFKSILGTVLSIGATMLLGPAGLGLSPVLAGAIGAGASSLVMGGKPADALKSALMGGVTSGLMSGFTGSGSFMENAFGNGIMANTNVSYSNPLTDKIKEMFGGASTASPSGTGATTGVEPGASSNAQSWNPDAASTVTADNIPQPVARPSVDLAPTVSAGPAAASTAASGIKGFISDYKWPLLIGGGAALLAASQAEKKNEKIEPSLLDKVNAADPNAGIIPRLDPANFVAQTPKTQPSVFPGGQYIESPIFPKGGYISPTQMAQQQPFSGYDYTKIRFPTYGQQGIAAAAAGGTIDGPGTGTSDSIPARLSDGEFVMTAKAVRGAGNGDRAKGAKKMYGIMHKFERMA